MDRYLKCGHPFIDLFYSNLLKISFKESLNLNSENSLSESHKKDLYRKSKEFFLENLTVCQKMMKCK